MKINVLVLFGGRSAEHEISVISAIQAIRNLDKSRYEVVPVYITKTQEMYTGEKIASMDAYHDVPALLKQSQRVMLVKDGDRVYLTQHPLDKKFKAKRRTLIDVAFPIVHGTNVEDGTLQGYLKTLGLPFVGCDVTASAVGMDKYVMKTVLKDAGVPVLDCLVLDKYRWAAEPDALVGEIERKFGYPVIVKPVNLGSSIGITKAGDRAALTEALELAFTFAPKTLIEHAVVQLREINCAVVGDTEEAEASECEEPLNATTILTFDDKYMGGGKNSKQQGQGMASLTRQIPANIPPETRKQIRDLAVRTFRALNCNGVARVDFLMDGADGTIYVNEINTIPGSLAFYLWEPLGIPYQKLLDRLIDLALKRTREEKSLVFTFDTNVLSMASDRALGGAKNKV